MTQKVYKTARGKLVDMGSLRLQNEDVRAVGNMNVNARGDRIDSQGNIIDSRSQQFQRQVKRTSNVTSGPVYTSVAHAAEAKNANNIPSVEDEFLDAPAEETTDEDVQNIPLVTKPVPPEPIPDGGLAAAIARSKVVKQELDPTARDLARSAGVRKL
jgi:hypothetical protein